jgi:sulfite exporter TauE/SafE
MCGGLSAAALQSHRGSDWIGFHTARICGYALLGLVLGAGMAGVNQAVTAARVTQPFLLLLHAACLLLGAALLWHGRQPYWISTAAHRISRVQKPQTQAVNFPHVAPRPARPVLVGFGWALMPCGLLYSALFTAALAATPWMAGAIMLAFGLGTAVAQSLVPVALRLMRTSPDGKLAIRISGALLAVLSCWALFSYASGAELKPLCG